MPCFVVESSRSERLSSTKSAHPHGQQEDVPQIKSTKSRSTADYQKPMAKAVASGNLHFRIVVTSQT